MTLEQLIQDIAPLDRGAMQEAQSRWNSIAKPLHGLGKLEEAVIQLAGITGRTFPEIQKKGVVVFCGDHGVVEEGVSQAGQEITQKVAWLMGQHSSVVCHMAKKAGAKVAAVDVGMAPHGPIPGLEEHPIRKGTDNLAQGPAMNREEGRQALELGAQEAIKWKNQGYQLMAAGEMGIGNTTVAAGLTAALLRRSPQDLVGPGAGLSPQGLVRKQQAVLRGLERNQPDWRDPLDCLCKVGGLDLAAMAGFYLGAAYVRLPVILDGALSGAAALLAVRLCPQMEGMWIASHLSREPLGRILCQVLNLSPLLDGRFCLGEGTGAVAMMPLLDMAVTVYRHMMTFDQLGMAAYVEEEDGERERRG